MKKTLNSLWSSNHSGKRGCSCVASKALFFLSFLHRHLVHHFTSSNAKSVKFLRAKKEHDIFALTGAALNHLIEKIRKCKEILNKYFIHCTGAIWGISLSVSYSMFEQHLGFNFLTSWTGFFLPLHKYFTATPEVIEYYIRLFFGFLFI